MINFQPAAVTLQRRTERKSAFQLTAEYFPAVLYYDPAGHRVILLSHVPCSFQLSAAKVISINTLIPECGMLIRADAGLILRYLYLAGQGSGLVTDIGVIDGSHMEKTRVLGIRITAILVDTSVILLVSADEIDGIFTGVCILRDSHKEGKTDGVATVSPASRYILGYLLLALESVPAVTRLPAGGIVKVGEFAAYYHVMPAAHLAAVAVIHPVLGKLLMGTLGYIHFPAFRHSYAGI